MSGLLRVVQHFQEIVILKKVKAPKAAVLSHKGSFPGSGHNLQPGFNDGWCNSEAKPSPAQLFGAAVDLPSLFSRLKKKLTPILAVAQPASAPAGIPAISRCNKR